jgi:hypothetical protein
LYSFVCSLLFISSQRDAHIRDAINLKRLNDAKTGAEAAAAAAAAAAEKTKKDYRLHIDDLNAAIGVR